jgi:hypothetical protein
MKTRQHTIVPFIAMSMLFLATGCQPVDDTGSVMTDLGEFESQGSVGAVQTTGSVDYDAVSQTYTIAGSGTNIWGSEDQFHFVWRRLSGDFILSADAAFIGEGVDPHRKLGWMIRTDLDTDSSYVDVALHGDGLTSLQFRRVKGGETEEVVSQVNAPKTLQLERRGKTYVMSVAKQGDALASEVFDDIDLPDGVYVGLFISAHNPDVVEHARISNVRITRPAPADFSSRVCAGSCARIQAPCRRQTGRPTASH